MARAFTACTVHALGEAPTPLRYTVMYIRYNGQWLHVRHRERDTWECAGGHIEPGETPEQCARREMFEEAGVVRAQIIPLFDYWVEDNLGNASGRVFLVQAEQVTDIPQAYEMAECMLSDGPPPSLTYRYIYGTLYPRVIDYMEGRLHL